MGESCKPTWSGKAAVTVFPLPAWTSQLVIMPQGALGSRKNQLGAVQRPSMDRMRKLKSYLEENLTMSLTMPRVIVWWR